MKVELFNYIEGYVGQSSIIFIFPGINLVTNNHTEPHGAARTDAPIGNPMRFFFQGHTTYNQFNKIGVKIGVFRHY